MTDIKALVERLLSKDSALSRFGFGAAPMDNKSQRAEARKAMREAAAALRDLTEWRDIAEHDNSAKEVLVETDKGAVMVAWRHHPSSRTDIWLSVPGRYQVTPVRFKPHPVRPLPSAPNLKETGE